MAQQSGVTGKAGQEEVHNMQKSCWGHALVRVLHKHRADAEGEVLLWALNEHRLLAAVQRQLVWAQARPKQRGDDAGQVRDLRASLC